MPTYTDSKGRSYQNHQFATLPGGMAMFGPSNVVRNSLRSQGNASGGFGSGDNVSPVNPQAGQANELDSFKRYEDAAFSNAMGRLTPQFEQQGQTFEQRMANQGIPVGSEAYNKARTQMDLSQNDARSNAAFNAMGFGADLQNQSFNQSHARSALANALAQAQMSKDVGMANVGLGRDELAQQGSQFNKSYGLERDRLAEDSRQFGIDMGQRAYEFDSGQDYDYWNEGNRYGLAERALDSGDYFNTWDRQTGQDQWNDDIIMRLLTGGAPGAANIDPNQPYNSQIGTASNNQGNMQNFWAQLLGSYYGG